MFTRFLIIFLCCFVPSLACADHGADLRVGVFPVEPIAFIDVEGNAQGLFPELIREIVREEGWEVTFVPGTLAESFERLNTNQIDMMAPIAYTEERARLYDYNDVPVIEVWGQVYVRPGSEIDSFTDLVGQRVGVVSAAVSGRNFTKTAAELGVTCEIITYPSFDAVFKAAAKAEVVAAVAPQHFGSLHSGKYGLVANSTKFSPRKVHFATLKGHFSDVLEHIDSRLRSWKNDRDSFYYDRVGYWINGTSSSRNDISNWLIACLFGVSACTFLLFYLNRTLTRKATTLSAKSSSELDARKKVEEELSARERTYRLTRFSVEHSHSAMVWLEPGGRFVDFNKKFCSYTGYSRDELFDAHIEDLCANCAERFRQIKEPLGQSESVQIETELTCKDGTQVPVLIEVSRFAFDGEEMLLAVITDISRRKRAEEIQTRLETELRQSQKMEAIGTLAGGIAHDFNNILTSMIGCTELALRRVEDDELMQKYLGVVRDGEHRATELVSQILNFARKDDNLVKEPVSMVHAVENTMKLLRASIPATVDIELSLPDSCPEVLANPSQINQIIINLITNAYQSLPKSMGRLEVKVEFCTLNAKQATKHLKAPPGEYLVLSVIDNGCGMTQAQQERVFDPYYTTRKQGEGTGFGLSIVQRVVQSHKGMVSLDSVPGEGSTFKVFLPIYRSEWNCLHQESSTLSAKTNEMECSCET